MLWLLLLAAQELPPPIQVIELKAELGHVQGIEVSANRLWVTDVDTQNKRGYLRVFSLPEGNLLQSVDVTQGERFHPGGIASDATSIWVPVAEYRREGRTVIQRRDKTTLKHISWFEFEDHIGAVAVDQRGHLIAANWDAKKVYFWNPGEDLVKVRKNPTGTAFQDWKFQDGVFLGDGILAGEGVLDWIDMNSWTLKKRIKVGRTDRGVRFTQEGMAFRDGKLYLLPEDGRSRLFVFRLPE